MSFLFGTSLTGARRFEVSVVTSVGSHSEKCRKKCEIMKPQITYIGHSGFLVEFEDCYLLFDYFCGEIPHMNEDKTLYIFVSHRHYDHYNRDIWQIKNTRKNVRYVIAKDIPFSVSQRNRMGIKDEDLPSIAVLRAGESFNGGIIVDAFASTDRGVAFRVTHNDCVVFHAGDLNMWKWEQNVDTNKHMERLYTEIVEQIKGKHIDIAFLPLDSRQEEYAFEGIEYFIENVLMESGKKSDVYPMHFWDKPEIIDELIKRHKEYKDKEIYIHRTGNE